MMREVSHVCIIMVNTYLWPSLSPFDFFFVSQPFVWPVLSGAHLAVSPQTFYLRPT